MDQQTEFIGKTLYSPTGKRLGTVTGATERNGSLRALTVERSVPFSRGATLGRFADGITIQKPTRRKPPAPTKNEVEAATPTKEQGILPPCTAEADGTQNGTPQAPAPTKNEVEATTPTKEQGILPSCTAEADGAQNGKPQAPAPTENEVEAATPTKERKVLPQIEITFPDEDEDVPATAFPTASAPLHTPSRIVANYTFLLGRTTTQDIELEGSVLPQGTLIVASIVELVRSHGKLFELTLKSKTPPLS